jgi:molybdopterin converting factor small subunit
LAQQIDAPEFWMFLEEGSTVGDFLKKLEKDKGIKINLNDRNIVILVNGRSIKFLGNLEAKLRELNKIVIMPVVAGGLFKKSTCKP